MNALWLSLAAGLALADPPEALRTQEGALPALARSLAKDLSAHSPQPPVALWVRGPSPELARALETLLASELSARRWGPMPLEVHTAEAAEAAARAAGARCLLRLTVSLEAGALLARGDVLGTWQNFWSGTQPLRPALPAAAILARAEADASALALASSLAAKAPSPSEGPMVLMGGTFARLGAPPSAIAAGDLDGDGLPEVAALTDEEVLLFSAQGKLLARHEHRGLPNPEAPCREPFGAIAIAPSPPRVLYFSARRGKGESLLYEKGAGLRPQGTLQEAPLALLGAAVLFGRFTPGTTTFAPEVSLEGSGPTLLRAAFTTASSRAGAFLVVYPDGAAAFSPAGPSERLRLGGAGAGSALADLGGDGQLSVVTSSTRYAADPDELRVIPVATLQALVAKSAPVDLAAAPPSWQGHSLQGKVLSIAAANLDAEGADELLLGVWLADGSGELQVFRRAAR